MIKQFFENKFNIEVSINSIYKRLKVRANKKITREGILLKRPSELPKKVQKVAFDELKVEVEKAPIIEEISPTPVKRRTSSSAHINPLIMTDDEDVEKMTIPEQKERNASLPFESRTYIGFEKIKPKYIFEDEHVIADIEKLEHKMEYGLVKNYVRIDDSRWRRYLARYEEDDEIRECVLKKIDLGGLSSFDKKSSCYSKYPSDLLDKKRPIHIKNMD